MNEGEITKGNKLIAEFMGGEICGNKVEVVMQESELGPIVTNRVAELKYHSSWDWLIPVVEKIEEPCNFPDGTIKEGVDVIIRYRNCKIEYSDEDRMYDLSPVGEKAETKIEAVWKACVKFIQWYNKNKSNP